MRDSRMEHSRAPGMGLRLAQHSFLMGVQSPDCDGREHCQNTSRRRAASTVRAAAAAHLGAHRAQLYCDGTIARSQPVAESPRTVGPAIAAHLGDLLLRRTPLLGRRGLARLAGLVRLPLALRPLRRRRLLLRLLNTCSRASDGDTERR